MASQDQQDSQIYYPPGWSHDRLLHSTGADLMSLPQGDSDRMFSSLRTALGPDGFASLVQEVTKNESEREAESRVAEGKPADPLDDLSSEQRFPVLGTLKKWYPKGKWGWVAFRCVGYEKENEARWREFEEKFAKFIRQEFDCHGSLLEIKEAEERFEIRWIERKDLEGAGVETVAKEYRELLQSGGLEEGLAHGMCLMVAEEEMKSILDSPFPTPSPVHGQILVPFVRAVDSSAGEDGEMERRSWEEHGHRTSFKVAVSALTGDLFTIMFRTIRSPKELGVGFDEKKVYLSNAGRFGRFTLGLSQRDSDISRR